MAHKEAPHVDMMPTDMENKFLSRAEFEAKYRKIAEKKAFLKAKSEEFDKGEVKDKVKKDK